jgi:aryl-alcohol dehydrogenase (NADP+)
VDACLRRLGTDYIDLLQIHRLDPGVRMEETLEALHDVVRAGKARYLGASSMPAWRFSQALHLADVNGWTRFISMQGHWNLLYREEEREMVPLCVDQGIGYLPWSPLARGRLARPWGSTSARTESDRFGAGLYVDADQAIVEAVGREADGLGVPRSQVALAWLLQRPAVSSIIVGLTKPRQLNDALVALDLELTATTLTALDEAYRPRAVAGYE